MTTVSSFDKPTQLGWSFCDSEALLRSADRLLQLSPDSPTTADFSGQSLVVQVVHLELVVRPIAAFYTENAELFLDAP